MRVRYEVESNSDHTDSADHADDAADADDADGDYVPGGFQSRQNCLFKSQSGRRGSCTTVEFLAIGDSSPCQYQ